MLTLQQRFLGHHNHICGRTRSGKTVFALNQAKRESCGIFFFNPQMVETPWTRADRHDDLDIMMKDIQKGGKIDYIPSANMAYAKTELNAIIYTMFAGNYFKNKPMLFVIDEAHIVARQGENNKYVCQIPVRGLALGICGVFITQRPANLDKTLITQSTRHYIFRTGFEKAYFAEKGINIEEVNKILDTTVEGFQAECYCKWCNGAKNFHNYIVYEEGQIYGPFRERV